MTRQAISEFVKRTALEAGFDLAGIAPVRDFPELGSFSEWIESGYAGEMKYMEARDDFGVLKRSSLRAAVPWARSVVVCAINYNTAQPYSIEAHDPGRGWISRYAWAAEDYHDAVLRRLRGVEANLHEFIDTNRSDDPALRTWCYVDTGPLVERVYAKYAGVGWIGKNTCIINQKQGSWLFLGVILTSLELLADMPAPDRCGTCTSCIDACPTDALIAPYRLDSNKCISYLTIEKRGTIAEDLHATMGRHVFGCDICQDVCPWNRKAPVTAAAEFHPREGLVNPALEWLAQMTPEGFRQTFKGSPIRRSKRTGIRRNAVIAMGNSGEQRFVPVLEQLCRDEDTIVAETAKSALERLQAMLSTEASPFGQPL
jgi:epoxyqueuosine reductase